MRFWPKWGGSMRVFHLAAANIKSAKSAAVSLFIFVFIAALLLNVGASVMLKMDQFYEDKSAALKEAHVNMVMSKASYKPSYGEFIYRYSGVTLFEQEPILLSSATIRFGDIDFAMRTVVQNVDETRILSPLQLVGESKDASSVKEQPMGIYIPYSLKLRNNYQLGDRFTLTINDKKLSYPIIGFFESTLLGSTKMGSLKLFLTANAYQQLSAQLGPTAQGVLLSVTLTEPDQSSALLRDYNKQFPLSSGVSDPSFAAVDIETVKSSSASIVNIVAMIIVGFAIVIVLVSLAVIKFRVTNSIQDGMTNIGILQAIGYRNREILASTVYQFMIIAIAATIAGISAAYACLPLFGRVISSLTGLIWEDGWYVLANLLNALLVMLLVLAVSIHSSWRIHKLHPVTVLRGGFAPHSFKRNFFPLDKAKGGLQFVLACKAMLGSSKQNMMIASITTAITLASVFSVVLYYNISEDKTAFFQMLGAETPNVGIQVAPGRDSSALIQHIRQMNGVEKASLLDNVTTIIAGQFIQTEFSDDFNLLETNTVYEGRYPQFDNEIVVTNALAKLLDKNIGDFVEVEAGENRYPFLITGLKQSFSTGRYGASMTIEGLQHLIPDYQGFSINVYLDKWLNKRDFMRNIQAEHGAAVQSVTDADESVEDGMKAYTSAIFSVMVVILASTVLIVVLILYLVIQTSILKQKRELGILKAIGYTTFQLMTQILYRFFPAVILGVGTGGLLGAFYTNGMLELLFSGIGISNVQFAIPIPLLICLCLSLLLLSYLVTLLVARRIKRITPYGLLTD